MISRIAPALTAAAGLALCSAPALAHHSFAMFDREHAVTLVGAIKEFQWTNPHSWIQIEAPDANGVVKEWSIESNSTGTLSREGWRPGSFKPGDKVTIRMFPMKDGSPGGTFVGAVLADGKTLGRMTP
jgi:hypothetical protein